MNSKIKKSQESPQRTIQKLRQDLEKAQEEKNMYANWNSVLQSSLQNEQIQKSEYAQTIKVLKKEIQKLKEDKNYLEEKILKDSSLIEQSKQILEETNSRLRNSLATMQYQPHESIQYFQDYYCIVKNGTTYFYKYQ
jgi:chromosome segregation ATPase